MLIFIIVSPFQLTLHLNCFVILQVYFENLVLLCALASYMFICRLYLVFKFVLMQAACVCVV